MPTARLLIIALLLALIAGCGLAYEANLRKQVLEDPATPAAIKESIEHDRIRVGMSKDQVVAAWGSPCWYCPGTRENSWGDTWEYNPFGTGRYSIGAGTYLFFDSAGHLKHWSKP